jgi:hypothetical protein
MTDQPITHVIEFQKAEVSPEEMVRRQRVEAERLARLSPGEWVLWIDASAARLGVPRAPLEAMVKALVAQREKDRRERKADDERHRREQTKRKEREFKLVAELPERERDARLDGLARRLGEDPAAVRAGFEAASLPPVDSAPELWPEPVDSAKLLADLDKQIRRYVVIRKEGMTATVLFTAMCWIHNGRHAQPDPRRHEF